jgi:hypothetical protein
LQQRQRGGVERAAREEVRFVAQREEAFHCRVDVHPALSGLRVDVADETVGQAPRIARLEARDPIERFDLKSPGHGGGGGHAHPAPRRHRTKLPMVRAAFDSRAGRGADALLHGRIHWNNEERSTVRT